MGLKFCLLGLVCRLIIIKIRPLWDWNFILIPNRLKFSFIKIRPLWDWNNIIGITNITKIVLKSDHCGIEIYTFPTCFRVQILIKIRPLWDWNPPTPINLSHALNIKIRPLWDWNYYKVELVDSQGKIKIRPLWDWNLIT